MLIVQPPVIFYMSILCLSALILCVICGMSDFEYYLLVIVSFASDDVKHNKIKGSERFGGSVKNAFSFLVLVIMY